MPRVGTPQTEHEPANSERQFIDVPPEERNRCVDRRGERPSNGPDRQEEREEITGGTRCVGKWSRQGQGSKAIANKC